MTGGGPNGHMSVEACRGAMREWIATQRDELAPFRHVEGELGEVFASLRKLQRLLYEAGWIRLGWPQDVGGLGGNMILRAVVSEELAVAGYPPPFSFGTQEVLGPAVARYAPTELAAEALPRLLSGDETWCQGFSEPEAGSDLAALSLRARDEGDHWRLDGEKVWTSWAQFADRCLVLARTGEPDSGHRGITAMFLDMDAPGLQLSPLVSMNGDEEFCSMHFDGVLVPKERLVGDVGGGWAVAKFILGCERGAAAWQRQAWMRGRLADLLEEKHADVSPARLGEAFELVHALRLLSRRTVRSLSAGESLGALPSFDKLLMSTAEKFLFDTALHAMPMDTVFGDATAPAGWRNDFLYSRASSIYGGTAEIQRNIVAERILGLPRS